MLNSYLRWYSRTFYVSLYIRSIRNGGSLSNTLAMILIRLSLQFATAGLWRFISIYRCFSLSSNDMRARANNTTIITYRALISRITSFRERLSVYKNRPWLCITRERIGKINGFRNRHWIPRIISHRYFILHILLVTIVVIPGLFNTVNYDYTYSYLCKIIYSLIY